jgi:hypothetical protein
MPKTGVRQLWQLPAIGGVRRSAPSLAGSVAGAGSVQLPAFAAAGSAPAVEGWTDLDELINSPAYASSRIVYVSTSGNDGTGTIYSPASSELGGQPTNPTGAVLPYATFAAAWAQVRDGSADVMLMRRGDDWGVTNFGLNKAGPSGSARIVVAAYGPIATARPLVGLVWPDSASAARNQIIAHVSMRTNSSGDVVTSGQVIRFEGCSFAGPSGTGQTPALVYVVSGGLSLHRNTYRRIRIFSNPVMGRAGFSYEECAFYHNPDYVQGGGGAEHNTYFNYQEGDGVSRFNISAFSPGVGLRQRGLGTVEGNLVLRPGTNSGWGFDIGTGSDENPTSPTRGTYLTFRYNLALYAPNADATFGTLKNAVIEQNIFRGRVAYYHSASVWPVVDVTMQDNILYNTDLSPWGGHSGTIQGPWLIRRNDIQRPAGGGMFTLSGAGFTFEANNRYFSSSPQSGWFPTAYSNWVPSTGSNTQVSYPAPDRDLVSYLQALDINPANTDEAIEWFMNGTAGFAGALNNRLGAWDDRATARAVIDHVRAGFGLGAVPPILADGPIAVDLRVEYVDAAGVFHSVTVNPNGSTVISGVAPFLVHFDATGTRGNLSNNNTLAGAFYNIGFRLNYGENRGTNWTYGKAPYLSRDEDFGPPIFGHVYEVVGTHLTRLKARDSNNAEVTVPLTVNVAAPPAPIIIEPSAGSFPTPVSGTHYRLRGGQSYASFGEWNLRRVHNVLVSKEGGGADPIAQIRIGGEDIGDLTVARERTRHVRLLNIDVTILSTGIYGPLNSGAINGRVRRVDQNNSISAYQGTTTETQRTQVLWPRNFFMYNTGLTSESGLPDYLMIGQHYRGWHMQGCRLQHPGGGPNNHILRNIQHRSTVRNCQLFSTYAPYSSRIKMQAEGTALWDANTDYVGPLSGPGGVGSATRYSNSFVVVQSVQFGGPGDQPPFGTTISFAPQNGDAGQQELHQCITVEDCQDTRPAASVVRGGSNLGARGLRNPDNSPWQTNEINFGLARIPLPDRGPYVTETDNTRPIPSAF